MHTSPLRTEGFAQLARGHAWETTCTEHGRLHPELFQATVGDWTALVATVQMQTRSELTKEDQMTENARVTLAAPAVRAKSAAPLSWRPVRPKKMDTGARLFKERLDA